MHISKEYTDKQAQTLVRSFRGRRAATPIQDQMPQPPRMITGAKAFPVALAQEDEAVCVIACHGDKGMERKLRDMGLPIGARARVVQHNGAGVVLAVGATHIALGAAAAQRVYVTLTAVEDGSTAARGADLEAKGAAEAVVAQVS